MGRDKGVEGVYIIIGLGVGCKSVMQWSIESERNLFRLTSIVGMEDGGEV